MRTRRLATAVLAAIILATGAGCGKEADEGGGSGSSGDGDGKRAALIIAQGGLGDDSYNDLANRGFEAALGDTGISGRAIESNDVVAQAQPILERASTGGFGLVIDLEFSHLEPLQKIAADNPDTRYGFLNAVVKGANVTSILFSEQEGSYLAGLLAALMTTQTENPKINPEKVIGVIGGAKSSGIDKFLVGYIEGAKAADPSVKVLTSYTNDFGDPSKGKQIADSMYDRGADIVFTVAGGSGAGVIEAAKERNRYAIGVDTDEDGKAPGFVLTSMIKRTDLAVKQLVTEFADDRLKGGETITLGLKEDGVGLSPMKHTKDAVPQEILDRVDEARQEIIDGKIKVWNVIDQGYPDFYKP